MIKTSIFVSSETDLMNGLTRQDSEKNRATINKYEKKIQSLLDKKDYGDALVGETSENGIGIIMTIYSKKFLETIKKSSGKEFPERKMYRKKSRGSDIRLRVDYEKFLVSNEKEREGLILENIMNSILVLDEKISKHKDVTFKGKELVNDIKESLKIKNEKI